MPIYTKTTFTSLLHPVPSDEDLANGIPKHPDLADFVADAIEKGHVMPGAQIELGSGENQDQHSIIQTWTSAETAQLYADLVVSAFSQAIQFSDSFVSCVVVTE